MVEHREALPRFLRTPATTDHTVAIPGRAALPAEGWLDYFAPHKPSALCCDLQSRLLKPHTSPSDDTPTDAPCSQSTLQRCSRTSSRKGLWPSSFSYVHAHLYSPSTRSLTTGADRHCVWCTGCVFTPVWRSRGRTLDVGCDSELPAEAGPIQHPDFQRDPPMVI